MNYIHQLLKEHSRINTDAIAKAIGNNTAEFKKIIDILYHEKAPLPQRASWLLAVINDKHPELLESYLPLFIATLPKFTIAAIKRNIMLVLASHQIPKKLQGKVVNLCFKLMLSRDEKVVVKVYAMQTIFNIAKKHPELQNELKAAIENQLPKTTASFHARARNILKKL